MKYICNMYERKRCGYAGWVYSLKGLGLLNRPWSKWDDGIEMDVRETLSKRVNWIDVGQGRDQWRDDGNKTVNCPVPWKIWAFFTSWTDFGLLVLSRVPTTGLFGEHSYSGLLAKCLPGRFDRVSTSRVLCHSLLNVPNGKLLPIHGTACRV